MRRNPRIQKLLKYRQSIEDNKRTMYAIIEEKQYAQQEKLFGIREFQKLCQNKLMDTNGDSTLHLKCLANLSEEAIHDKKELQKLQEEALKAKEELIEASKSRKKIEKLNERQLTRYRKYLLQQERKNLDEIAANQYTRNQIGHSGNHGTKL